MKLYTAYKKRLYANGGIVGADEVPGIAAPVANAIVPGTGAIVDAVGQMQSTAIDAIDKGDALTGRQSVLSYVAKGNAKGGTIGAAMGLMNGLKAKRQAGALLNEEAAQRGMMERDMSAGRLAANPTLYQGFKGSGYYALGGPMGPGGDPTKPAPAKPTPTYRPLSAQQITDWNGFLDHVKSKGLAGSKDLDNRNTGLGKQLIDEYKQKNPNFSLDYSWIPDVQNEYARSQADIQRLAAKQGRKGAYMQADTSVPDGWLGHRTSTQYLIPQTTVMLDGTERHDGLLNANSIPTTQMPNGKPDPFPGGFSLPKGIVPQKNDKGTYFVLGADGDALMLDDYKRRTSTGEKIELKPFANGGALDAPLARAFMKNGDAKQLSSNNVEFEGPSHAEGGIQIPQLNSEVEGSETTAGNYVFSKKLGFAQAHKPIAKAKGIIEKKPATFERVNAMKRLNARENELAQLQEQVKSQLQLQ